MRDWHHYKDRSLAILQDIQDAYPELGREWQDVFKLYSLGYNLKAIHGYWISTHGHQSQRGTANHGYELVDRLVRRIDWLIYLDTRPLKFGAASQDQDEALTQSG